MSVLPDSPLANKVGGDDIRQQNVNDRREGPAGEISIPAERITVLHAIMLDIDPGLFRPERVVGIDITDPAQFYRGLVSQWLGRDPLLRHAEVRDSGSGLHVLINLEPVRVEGDRDIKKWSAAIKFIQRLFPTDFQCPGITALTRPIGAVNSKNSRTVAALFEGQRVTESDVISYCESAVRQPFRTMVDAMFGTGKTLSPCPLCNMRESELVISEVDGQCSECGRVLPAHILAHHLQPVTGNAEVSL